MLPYLLNAQNLINPHKIKILRAIVLCSELYY